MKTLCMITLLLGLTAAENENIRLEDVAEICSGGNFITQDYNGWDLANSTINDMYYVPFVNKYTALLLSLNLFKTFQFESVNDVQLEDACISGYRTKGTMDVNLFGFNEGKAIINIVPTTTPKLLRFHLSYPNLATGSGYSSIALSDNYSYTLFDVCYDNGARGFLVISKYRQLDENTRNIIVAHLKSLGFKEKYFVDLNFDSCIEKDGVPATAREDLPKPFDPKNFGVNTVLGRHLVVPSVVVG